MNSSNKPSKTKVLRSHTIVPQNLYVTRQADRQLKKILEDKGRPGYVLVSRQMGKTNLLLNARRESQSASNHFIYLDISNNFPNLSSFFRNIIDVAIDTLAADNCTLKKQIEFNRSEGLYTNYPHKEHEQELRKLLSYFRGDITICLDEIDAIIKTNYSDAVFSFIRSVYFSGRVNFPEFQRLNYVLSGVAEPSELIKDKASSPFNIGEKIYLDDFSFDEFTNFVSKAEINLDTESRDRVFYWTNGNPRLTWDLLAKLEDCQIEKIDITISKIDELVKVNYLSAFDLPPIDHIRNLAEEDAEVRSCLISLHYGKNEVLTDQQKSKLYLAGIISSTITSGVPKIKNRIIAESLSESWLKEIDNSKLSIVDKANKYYELKQFTDAALYFEQYIDSTSDDLSIEPLVYHRLGSSYYELNQFVKAKDNFSKKPFTEKQLDLFLLQSYWKGMCCSYIDEFEKSIDLFNLVINKSKEYQNYKYYYDACTNLASVMLLNAGTNYRDVLEITQNVLTVPLEDIQKQSEKTYSNVSNLYSVCNANLFKIALSDGLNELAINHVNEAIRFADEHSKFGLMLDRIESQITKLNETDLLDEVISYIFDNNLRIAEQSLKYPNALNDSNLIRLITFLYRSKQPSKVKDLVNKLSNSKLHHETSFFHVLVEACLGFIPQARWNDFLELSKIAIALPEEFTDKVLLKDLLGLRILFDDKNSLNITEFDHIYIKNYWDSDEDKSEYSKSQLKDIDYKILDTIIKKFRTQKLHKAASELISKFKITKATDLIINDDDPLSISKNIIVTAEEIRVGIPILDEETIFNKAVFLDSLYKLDYSNELMYFNKNIFDEIKQFNTRVLINFKK